MGHGSRCLSDEEINKIPEMRKQGYTIKEIAKELHVSKSVICELAPKGINNRKPEYQAKYKYPNIKRWIAKNKVPARKLAKRLEIPESTLRAYMQGKVDIRKSVIDKILEITGMSYEQAFEEE